MPMIIGYMIGKMIAILIVSVITLMFRLIMIVCSIVIYAVKHSFFAARWILVKLWEGGRVLYDNYKLNLR